MNKDDIMKIIDGIVYYHYDYTDYLYRQLEIRDLILKALHKYFMEHEYYEANEFLRQLESVTENENDVDWLIKLAGDENDG